MEPLSINCLQYQQVGVIHQEDSPQVEMTSWWVCDIPLDTSIVT